MIKKILTISVSIGILLQLAITQTFAEQQYDISESNNYLAKFSPTRDYTDISGELDHPGFGYVTYNNFYYDNSAEYNSDTGVGGSYFDERKFTWAAFAEHTGLGITPADYTFVKDLESGETLYTKGWDGKFKDGDKIVFGVRFHNNGTDPHDGKTPFTPASKVTSSMTYAGVDVSNPEEPIGFIYSPENQYKKLDGTTLNYTAGDYIFSKDVGGAIGTVAKTASDSVVVKPTDGSTIKLKIDTSKAVLSMGYDYDGDSKIEPGLKNEWITWNKDADGVEHNSQKITGTYTANMPVEIPTNKMEYELGTYPDSIGKYTALKTIRFDLKNEGNKIWLQFESHPGCFKYSGWAYFTAEIDMTPPPPPKPITCQDLTLTSAESCNEETKTTNFDVKVNMDPPGTIMSKYKIEFFTDEENKDNPFSIKITTPDIAKPFTTWPVLINPTNTNQVAGEYTGTGNLYAQLTNDAGEPIKELITDSGGAGTKVITDPAFFTCTDKLSTCDNTCEGICVKHPEQIPVGSYSEFSAETSDYYKELWGDNIFYIANPDENGEFYGEFYATKDELLTAHPAAYPNPSNKSQPCPDFLVSLNAQSLINIIYKVYTPSTIALDNGATDKSGFTHNLLMALFNFTSTPPSATEPIYSTDTDAIDFSDAPTPTYPIYSIDTGDNTKEVSIKELDIGGVDIKKVDSFSSDIDSGILDVDYISAGDFVFLNLCNDPEPKPPSIIKAKQGASVWFYAKEAGTDKIEVKGECTDAEECSQKFSIIAAPMCTSVDWTTSPPADADKCIKKGTSVTITADNITFTTGNISFIAENETDTTIDWYSDPVDGTFSNNNDGPANPLSTKYNTVTYTGAADIHGYLSALGDDITFNESQLPEACKFSLPACPDEPTVCQKLEYTVESYIQKVPLVDNTTLPTNDIYIFKSSSTYSSLVAPNLINYKIDEKYGMFALTQDYIIPVIEVLIEIPDPVQNWKANLTDIPANEKVYFYPMQNLVPGKHANVIEITATGSDKINEKNCTKYLSLVVPAKDACEKIQLHMDPTWPPQEAPASTKLSITGKFGDYDGNFKFSVTSAGNIAYLSKDNKPDEIKPTFLEVTKDEAISGIYMFGPDLLTNWEVKVTALEEEIQTVCFKTIAYVPEVVVPKCESLKITKPSSPWTLDPDEKNEDFEVQVTGTPAGYPWTIEWKLPVNPEVIAHFEHAKTLNTYTNVLQNPYEGITAFIKVAETDPGVCEATLSPEPTVKINPSIKKKVRKGEMTSNPGNDKFDDEWDNLINVSAKDVDEDGEVSMPKDSKFVTYKVEFKPGEGKGVSSAVIKETLFNDGVLEGSKDGELVFQGNLWIEVAFKNSTDKKYFYEDVKDEEDKDDVLEICDNDTVEVCVTDPDGNANDYEDIADSFQDEDEGLVFNNIEDVKKITIFYELKNETALDQEICSELDAEKDGCGEEFPNEAEFEAYKENDLKGDKVGEGDDDAIVIAICPFILTRAGGDVFFSTELTSGIDVAYCSEQKNIVGPIIKGIKKEEQKTPKTGIGDVGSQAFLTTPTHDICKYSNVEGATGTDSAFDNPLENFSSTICEMQAEVAKEWQQEYIVKQINKNISALSLWHETLITNQFPPSTDTNIYSYTDKNIIIPGMVVETPAAQTYIVRNGDLNITGNITYKTIDMIGPLNPKEVPSAAFIVIDGNIIIDPAVTVLDGTFIAIDTDSSGADGSGDGLIKSYGFSYNQLTINGILIGNVADLFSKRRYSGSVSLDEGSVTIKFSQNFLFNTPPGLSQLLDLTQLRGAF